MREKERAHKARRGGTRRIKVAPGASVIKLLAAAVEKNVRAGAGLISVNGFPRRDFRMMPVLVPPRGRGLAPLLGGLRTTKRG